jgi:hypothetical protein
MFVRPHNEAKIAWMPNVRLTLGAGSRESKCGRGHRSSRDWAMGAPRPPLPSGVRRAVTAAACVKALPSQWVPDRGDQAPRVTGGTSWLGRLRRVLPGLGRRDLPCTVPRSTSASPAAAPGYATMSRLCSKAQPGEGSPRRSVGSASEKGDYASTRITKVSPSTPS